MTTLFNRIIPKKTVYFSTHTNVNYQLKKWEIFFELWKSGN
jgi:hypothetical protein